MSLKATRISKLKNAENVKEDYHERLLEVVNAMISFFEWFNQLHPSRRLTVRDLISWVDFLDVMEETLGPECTSSWNLSCFA
ncbi:hypothetical protein AHAS_Ahas12G0179500 [Arachis hypogaea]